MMSANMLHKAHLFFLVYYIPEEVISLKVST